MKTRPSTEREWWDLLITQTPESMAWKGQFDQKCISIRGHLAEHGGLRAILASYADYLIEGNYIEEEGYYSTLNDLHPRSVLLLAQYGIEFEPYLWERPPPVEPGHRICFANSWSQQFFFNQIMREEKEDARMGYVEGIAFGGRTEPVHHGWNSMNKRPGLAFDTSWYASTGWTFYFGLPLTEEECVAACKLVFPNGERQALLKKEAFPKVEEYLRAIFTERALNRPAAV